MEIARDAGEAFLVERAGRNEDPPGPDDLPLSALRGGERRHARIGPDVRPRGGIEDTQLIPAPQLGLGPQTQVGLGPLIAAVTIQSLRAQAG